MTTLDAMTEAFLLATGKSTLPAVGSTKYNRLLGLCKKFYRDWQTEPGVDWNSLHGLTSAGTVSATDVFDLEDEILKVSQRKGDFIRVLISTGNYSNFTLVPASQLYRDRYSNTVARIGQTIKFSRTFTVSDPEFGKSISVPAFLKLDDLVALTDEVLIDNPAWLPPIVAAGYVLPDAQLSYQYPDLIEQAKDLTLGMKLANNTQDDSYSTGEDYFSNGLGVGSTQC